MKFLIDVSRKALNELEAELSRERATPGCKIEICNLDSYARPVHIAVEIGGTIVGAATLEIASPESVELHKLYVHPEFRGRGIGVLLADQACLFAKANGSKELDIEVSGDSGEFWRRWRTGKRVEHFPV